jgi:hypothetical protein
MANDEPIRMARETTETGLTREGAAVQAPRAEPGGGG